MKRNTLNQKNTKQLEQKKKLQKETVQVEEVIMINGKVKDRKVPEEMAQGSKLFICKERQK